VGEVPAVVEQHRAGLRQERPQRLEVRDAGEHVVVSGDRRHRAGDGTPPVDVVRRCRPGRLGELPRPELLDEGLEHARVQPSHVREHRRGDERQQADPRDPPEQWPRRTTGHREARTQQCERRQGAERPEGVPSGTGRRDRGAGHQGERPHPVGRHHGQVQPDERTHGVPDHVDRAEAQRTEDRGHGARDGVEPERTVRGRRGPPAGQVDEHQPAVADAVRGVQQRCPRRPGAGDAVQQQDRVRAGAVVHHDGPGRGVDDRAGQPPGAGRDAHRVRGVGIEGDPSTTRVGVDGVHRASCPTVDADASVRRDSER
jgi:hypothetical protein